MARRNKVSKNADLFVRPAVRIATAFYYQCTNQNDDGETLDSANLSVLHTHFKLCKKLTS